MLMGGAGVPPHELSPHVAKGAVSGAHAGAAAASGAAMSPNAGAPSLDAISPAEGGCTVRNGQAGDGELNAIDGSGGHDAVAVAC